MLTRMASTTRWEQLDHWHSRTSTRPRGTKHKTIVQTITNLVIECQRLLIWAAVLHQVLHLIILSIISRNIWIIQMTRDSIVLLLTQTSLRQTAKILNFCWTTATNRTKTCNRLTISNTILLWINTSLRKTSLRSHLRKLLMETIRTRLDTRLTFSFRTQIKAQKRETRPSAHIEAALQQPIKMWKYLDQRWTSIWYQTTSRAVVIVSRARSFLAR